MLKYSKQVKKAHYEFKRYMLKDRWNSMWHQLDEIQRLKPENVLEIGPGPGLLKTILLACGIKINTFDLDIELNPDYVGSLTSLPFQEGAFDIICAFQVLEHLPYEVSLQAFGEMVRVSRRSVVISLPDARNLWQFQVHIPRFGPKRFSVPRPQLRMPVHQFDGEHYWEVNKSGYPLSKVIADFTKHIRLIKTYRVQENSSHRFFVFQR